MPAHYILHIAYPLFLGLIVLEYYFYKKRKQVFPSQEAYVSLVIAIAYQIVNMNMAPLIKPLQSWFYAHSLFEIPMDRAWAWLLGVFAVEFAYYWQHRCSHRVRWLWASHVVHHTPPQMTFSGAYRIGVTGALSGIFIFFLPLLFLGFPPQMVAILYALNLVYQFWLHTELIPKLGPLEAFLNTPSHHRVHHAINESYINKNFGGILIIFDRIFGTFAVEDQKEIIRYGVLGKEPTRKLGSLLFKEWRDMAHDLAAAKNPREFCLFAFGRPGWRPEKSLEKLELPAREQESLAYRPPIKKSQ